MSVPIPFGIAVTPFPKRAPDQEVAQGVQAVLAAEPQGWRASAQRYLMPNYQRQPLAFVRGEGPFLFDTAGRRYLDFTSGIGVTGLGHAHPAVTAAITAQAQRLLHTSNHYEIPLQAEAARLLSTSATGGQVLFVNSGTEANEAAIKLARRYHYAQGYPQRTEILSFYNGFHGRTFGSLAATAQPKLQEGFGPMPADFRYAAYNDTASFDQACSARTAAVVLELIQGEGGVVVAQREFVQHVAQRCHENGWLLIVDEVQTGVGRTGSWWAYQQYGIEPDVITCAKAMGNGVPVGAVIARPQVAAAFIPGTHGSTFGGNPLAMAAVIATLQTIQSKNLVAHALQVGAQLGSALQRIAQSHATISEVRGRGLMWGVAFQRPVAPLIEALAQRGLLALAAGQGDVLRFLPPLIIEGEEITAATEALDAALTALQW